MAMNYLRSTDHLVGTTRTNPVYEQGDDEVELELGNFIGRKLH